MDGLTKNLVCQSAAALMLVMERSFDDVDPETKERMLLGLTEHLQCAADDWVAAIKEARDIGKGLDALVAKVKEMSIRDDLQT